MHGYKRARARSWLVGAVALMMLTAACAAESGGSDDPDGSGATGGTVLGDTIKIGGLVTKTSSVGYNSTAAEIGAKARFDRANAEGGVNGRKIDFIGAEDDGMVPATGEAAVKKLVQRDKVFAIVPWVAPTARSAEVPEAAGVTRFGWGTNDSWCGSEISFPFSGCLVPKDTTSEETLWNRGYVAHVLAKELGSTDGMAKGQKVWIQGFDNSESKRGVEVYNQVFKASGFDVAGTSSSIPVAAPPSDWLPYINKIMKSADGGPPDVVFSVMSGKTNLGMYGALRQAGFQGVLADASSYDPALVASAQGAQVLEGVYTSVGFAPFESGTAEVQQFMADVRKTDPKHVFTQNTAMGYWSADIFLTALENAGKDVTAASFLASAQKLTYDNPGLGKLTFPANKTEPGSCAALVQVKGGKYTVAQPLTCFDR
ncbi:ABC transporter substrate-binding protein [Streptomyces sp. NPDC091292]|uniref:ABC transporter substrate-binding protein n=1 Tax=Streptomyces sp. NPDC091292 TaxID=3365991 RepID=UPI0038176EC3